MSEDTTKSFQKRSNDEDQAQEVANYYEDTTAKAQWGIVAGVFFMGGLMGAFSNPTDPAAGFLTIGLFFGFVAWSFATNSGKAFREDFIENLNEAQQQQQQLSSNSKPKVNCRNCGWQNPKDNNFCHDCGSELTS